jgi:hypothetical protein
LDQIVYVLVDNTSTMEVMAHLEVGTTHVAAVTATAALQEHLATMVQDLEITTAPTVHLLEAVAVGLHQ